MDGGRAALSGFLYQIVGSAGLLASDGHMGNSTDVDFGLSLAGSAELEQEFLDQDAVVRPGGDSPFEYFLLQFKYTGTHPPGEIARGDVAKIVGSFQRSFESLNEPDARTKCVVYTNRRLAPSGRRALAALRRRKDGRLATATFKTDYDSTAAIRRIEALGNELGLSPRELNERLNQVVGEMVRDIGEAGGRLKLTREWLEGKFAGHVGARRLTRDAVADILRADHAQFARDRHMPANAIRRDVQSRIERARGAAIILLRGDGGVGKTVLLTSLSGDALAASTPSSYVAVEGARNLTEKWLSGCVQRWRNVPDPREYAEQCFTRLVTAHGDGEPPVLIVGIDGLDELAATRTGAGAALDRLLRFVESRCIQPNPGATTPVIPEIRLILTYRHREDLATWSLDTREEHIDSGRILYEEVGHYEDDELLRASVGASPDVRSRIEFLVHQDALRRGRGDMPEDPQATLGGTALHAEAPGSSETLDALRHPTILQLFLEMQVAEQVEYLEEDPHSAERLWDAFVSRFIAKMRLRFETGLTDSLTRALRVAARSTELLENRPFEEPEFVSAALGSGAVSEEQAHMLYREATSYGALVEDPQDFTWHWVHPGLRRHLAARHHRRRKGSRS